MTSDTDNLDPLDPDLSLDGGMDPDPQDGGNEDVEIISAEDGPDPAHPDAPLSPAAAKFATLGSPPPARTGPPIQLGLGPLMGLGTVAPRGKYSEQGLRAAALDSLKNTCLGSGTKVPEEVSAVKAALDAAVGVREDELVKALCPADVLALLSLQAWSALDAGVPLPIVAGLWPEVTSPENAEGLRRVVAWRDLRISLRLFSRFESMPDAPGLAAYKVWHDTHASTTAMAARTGPGVREPLLRDAVVDDPALLGGVLSNVIRLRAKAVEPSPSTTPTPSEPTGETGSK